MKYYRFKDLPQGSKDYIKSITGDRQYPRSTSTHYIFWIFMLLVALIAMAIFHNDLFTTDFYIKPLFWILFLCTLNYGIKLFKHFQHPKEGLYFTPDFIFKFFMGKVGIIPLSEVTGTRVDKKKRRVGSPRYSAVYNEICTLSVVKSSGDWEAVEERIVKEHSQPKFYYEEFINTYRKTAKEFKDFVRPEQKYFSRPRDYGFKEVLLIFVAGFVLSMLFNSIK